MGAKRANAGTTVVLTAICVVIAACSGTPSAEVLAFCDDYVTVQGLMTVGPDEADPMPWVEDLTEGLEGLKQEAPSTISVAVENVADALVVPVQALDEEAYMGLTASEEFTDDLGVINQYVGDECGFGNASVTAVDFAFDADLDELETGQTMFEFNNDGAELHEMVLIRINDDTTETVEQLLELPEEDAEQKTTFMGVAFAEPGGESTMFADLEAGRYVVLCFIPTGTTSFEDIETADGPPHFTRGMVKEFTVES